MYRSGVVISLLVHIGLDTVEELNVAFADIDCQKMQKKREDQDVKEPEV